jgi:hypothetical protein
MSRLFAAFIFLFILALGATGVRAEQITCESRGDRAEACGTVVAGSDVRLIQQISNSPCIEGRSWGADNDSIWVSNGCRAVFDVQPRYSSNDESYYYDADRPNERSVRERHYGSRYASDESGRSIANSACVARVTADQPFGEEQIGTTDVRRISNDLFIVSLNTPKGPVSCTADRAGSVRSIEMDFR